MVGRYTGWIGLMDCPNERSSHCTPTPRGGGIGILAALVFSAMASGMSMAFWLLVGALWIDLYTMFYTSPLCTDIYILTRSLFFANY
jgi:UDP-N-acetylmuramyl pentapeptide phosphotransferase/UDP-N-acetylglucosamine-1-phosphate transferase